MKFTNIKRHDTAVCSIRVFRSTFALTLCLATMLACLSGSPAAIAQQRSALASVYGRGVHAYFAGNSTQAEQYFTEVIQAGSTDPRAYYFRAVLRLGQGRQFEAENDMRVGAAYEARNPGTHHSIGRSLQRVQGPGRRTLEKFRRQARLDRVQQGRQQTLQRYEQLERRGPQVIRREAPLPMEQPIQPPLQVGVPSPAQPMPTGSGAKEAGSGTKSVGSGTKPMGSDTKPMGSGTKDTSADPFGAPAPVTPAEDPFGDSPEPTMPAAEADPFGNSPAPAEADPFGDVPALTEPTPQPEPEMPASEMEMTEDDPFGADASGESPMEESDSTSSSEEDDPDPFGETAETEEMPSEAPAEQPPAAEEEADDPFGDATESSAESSAESSSSDADADDEDPFGDSSATDDSGTSDEEDPFGDSMDEEDSSEPAGDDSAPADEDAPALEADEDDPFGDFGAVSPRPASESIAALGQATAADGSTAMPVVGTATGPSAGKVFFALGQWFGSRSNPASVTKANHESAQAEVVVQAGFELGPSDSNEPSEGMTSEDKSSDSPEDDPFADDPFGDF